MAISRKSVSSVGVEISSKVANYHSRLWGQPEALKSRSRRLKRLFPAKRDPMDDMNQRAAFETLRSVYLDQVCSFQL